MRTLVIGLLLLLAWALWWTLWSASPATAWPSSTSETSLEPLQPAQPTPAASTVSQRDALDPVATSPTPSTRSVGSLRIRVADEDEHPVPMVGVVLTPLSGQSPVFAGRYTATDRRGLAHIADLPVGRVRVRIDRAPFRIASIRPGVVTEVKFALSRGDRVRGLVVDSFHQPIPNATVWVRRRAGNSFGEPVGACDPDGTFDLRCLARSTFLGVTAPGFAASAMQPVQASRQGVPQKMKFVLQAPAAPIQGLVLDASGRPLADAVIRIGGRTGGDEVTGSTGDVHQGWAPVRVRSRPDGSFTSDSVPAGEIEFLVHAKDHAPYTKHFQLRSDTQNSITIELERGATLAGRVVDESANPIARAYISVSSFGYTLETYAETGADGRFHLDALDSRRMLLRIRADGFSPFVEEQSVTAEPRLERVFQLQRIGQIRGRITDPKGVTLPGWVVGTIGRSGSTAIAGEKGDFELPISQPAVELRFSAPKSRQFYKCAWLGEVSPGKPVEVRIPAHLFPSIRIRGHLTREDGTAPPRATVTLRRGSSIFMRTIASQRDGAFSLQPLPPGDYQLEWRDKSRSSLVLGTVQVPNLTADLDLGAIPTHGPGTIRGGILSVRASRRDGLNLEQPLAFIFEAAGKELGTLPLRPDGVASMRLAPGQYFLRLMSNNAEWRRREFRIESDKTTEVKITVPPAARRYILFPWPMPKEIERLPAASQLSYVIRSDKGETLSAETLPREEFPHMYMPSLSTGVHNLRLEVVGGPRFEGTFRISELGKSHRPVLISVSPTR